jgi:CRP/FNR family cyclic AMP-dependent transcriptional regulator
MIEHNPDIEQFKAQMQQSLLRETQNSRAIKIAKHDIVYSLGEKIANVYFIASGQIKLATYSFGGKECILAIHGAGDVFGELCLANTAGRQETATAMEETSLKAVDCDQFMKRLARDSLLEGFIRYLTVRVADQQGVIANLATVDSEQRLGQTLLQIARKHGKKDPRSIRIELRISHDELGKMVGTTRPRISLFMERFRNLGLIELSDDRHLIIKEHKLVAYLASIA